MRFYQPLALSALVGLVATSPVPFSEDALAVREPEAQTAGVAASVVVRAKGAKGKAKGKAKKGKKRDVEIDLLDDIIERSAEAEPLGLDTIVVARTSEADVENLAERSPEPQAKGKKGKGKGKGKAKKGKKRDAEVDFLDDIAKRSAEAEPLSLDTIVVARTAEADAENLSERSPEPQAKGKKGKAKKGKAKKGKKRDVDDLIERSPEPQAKGKKGKGKGKAKKGKKRDVEDLLERDAAPEALNLADIDTVVVARELADLVERSPEPQAKGKAKKGKGKAKKGKAAN